MKIRAIENFSGKIAMSIGDERELDNEVLLNDLLKAGYIEEIAPVQLKKRGKKDESERDNE